jgi:hypothetical protein
MEVELVLQSYLLLYPGLDIFGKEPKKTNFLYWTICSWTEKREHTINITGVRLLLCTWMQRSRNHTRKRSNSAISTKQI